MLLVTTSLSPDPWLLAELSLAKKIPCLVSELGEGWEGEMFLCPVKVGFNIQVSPWLCFPNSENGKSQRLFRGQGCPSFPLVEA